MAFCVAACSLALAAPGSSSHTAAFASRERALSPRDVSLAITDLASSWNTTVDQCGAGTPLLLAPPEGGRFLPGMPESVLATLQPATAGDSHHLYASLVYHIHREDKAVDEALTLHSSISKHDPAARFAWFVHPDDEDELRGWNLTGVTLLPINDADLCVTRVALGMPQVTHHSGPSLVWFKLLFPLLLPAPFMVADTDMVARAPLAPLWTAGGAASAPLLLFGVELGRLNSGLLYFDSTPGEADWRSCLSQGTEYVQAHTSFLSWPEQSVLNWVCGAALHPTYDWDTMEGTPTAPCSAQCAPFADSLFMTGCSVGESADQTWDQLSGADAVKEPPAIFHYNCNSTLLAAEREAALRASPAYESTRPAV